MRPHTTTRIAPAPGGWEALREADEFFGRTVILAARIAAQAQSGEILASALMRELTQSSGDLKFGADRVLELKGIAEPQLVFVVDGQTVGS